MIEESVLGYALLGLLHEEPRSGYDLRKLFATTPMGLFSDSPGAVYPALRRLARRGWIASGTQSRQGRRRQTFVPTPAGRDALLAWLVAEPTYDDAFRRWDVLMLRLALMTDAAGISDARRLIDTMARLAEDCLGELERYLEGPGQNLSTMGRLVFSGGIEAQRARVRWAQSARRDLQARRRL